MSMNSPSLCRARTAVLLLAATQLSACSTLASLPSLALVKVSTGAALEALPGRASNTVHHGDAPISSVCIEFNRNAQLADLVPALQAELREQRVASRVYEAGTDLQTCPVWLRYAATIEWDIPPLATRHRAYLSGAALSLQRADGRLMASSHYRLDEELGISKWADTRRKLARVVKAVITGFES